MSTKTEAEFKVEPDFEYLLTFLPPGWELKAKELGALRRCRKFPDAKVLFLSLQACLENWDQISLELREAPRKRGLQIEKLEQEDAFLS
jgi:hypothetical protein